MGMRTLGLVMAGGAATFLSIPAGHAAVATFEGAAGTPDTYPGTAGDGWQAGWQLSGPGTASVSDAVPLVPDGNNYVQLTNTSSNAAMLARQLSTSDKIYAEPFTVSFDLRVDQLEINGSPDGGVNIGLNHYPGTTGGNASVQIRVAQLGGMAQWLISHGSDATNDTSYHEVRSGVAFGQDTLYRFVIEVDPTSGTYDVSINGADIDPNDAGAPATGYTFGERFNFRAVTADATEQSWFAVGIQSNGSEGAVGLSLDNVSIVPEPGSLGTAAMALTALALRRRRD